MHVVLFSLKTRKIKPVCLSHIALGLLGHLTLSETF